MSYPPFSTIHLILPQSVLTFHQIANQDLCFPNRPIADQYSGTSLQPMNLDHGSVSATYRSGSVSAT